jgi:hypothetical protein
MPFWLKLSICDKTIAIADSVASIAMHTGRGNPSIIT